MDNLEEKLGEKIEYNKEKHDGVKQFMITMLMSKDRLDFISRYRADKPHLVEFYDISPAEYKFYGDMFRSEFGSYFDDMIGILNDIKVVKDYD